MKYRPLRQDTAIQFRELILQHTPDAVGRWGKLNALTMLTHLCRTLEMSLGHYVAKDESNFFTRTVFMRRLIFEWMPWPKGKIKGPEYVTPTPQGDFLHERERLLALLEEFVGEHQKNPQRTTQNPILGKLSLQYWSIIHGRHICWHLEQFRLDTKSLKIS